VEIAVSQLRLNPLTGRWVTIVAERAERPTDFAPRRVDVEADPARPCPFCPGHEEASPPALETLDEGGAWTMRVVPNLFPAFDGQEPFAVHHLGPVHVAAEASGIHEVFVLTPDHDGGVHAFDDRSAADMMSVLKRRLLEHGTTPNIRYTQAIINHGREAGASLVHPHGQLLGLPFVPGEILDEQRAFTRFEGGCILCATIEAELVDGKRVVFATDDVVCVCPFWSGAPFELLIIPRSHDLHLTDSDEPTLRAVGVAIRDALQHLTAAIGDVSYNLVFHTAPHHYSGEYHWHVHLWPKLVTTAGFERGTGVLINIVPPEAAAEHLRRVSVHA
jgi:UDPglucose--hexose-1-phosphate uridylyltransferase